MNKRRILIIAVAVIFLSSAGIVTFLSAQDGGARPAADTRGTRPPAPLETRYAPDRIFRTTGAGRLAGLARLGVLVSLDGGTTWSARNQGLPMRAVYPFTVDKPPIITGLAVDPLDNDRVGPFDAGHPLPVGGRGLSWEKLELKDPIRANDQLTCVALSPGQPRRHCRGHLVPRVLRDARQGKIVDVPLRAARPAEARRRQLRGDRFPRLRPRGCRPDLVQPRVRQGPVRPIARAARPWTAMTCPRGPSASPIRDIAFRRGSRRRRGS